MLVSASWKPKRCGDWVTNRFQKPSEPREEGRPMTDAEWLTCTDVVKMLLYLRGDIVPSESQSCGIITGYGPLIPGEAKRIDAQRLVGFAQECCRNWRKLPLDKTSILIVEDYERFLAGE